MKFSRKVYTTVSKIPKGKVATYGLIATLLNQPRNARQVGWVLSNLSPDSSVPWWRVVNSKGYLSIRNQNIPKDIQKQLLEREGVKIEDDFTFDLDKFIWNPK